MLAQESAARKDRTSGNSAKLEHRHFAFIAATLAECKPDPTWTAEFSAWLTCVERFTDACRATNPRFDRNRFMTACGVEK